MGINVCSYSYLIAMFEVFGEGEVCIISLIMAGSEFQFCMAVTENDDWPNVLFLNVVIRSPSSGLTAVMLDFK